MTVASTQFAGDFEMGMGKPVKAGADVGIEDGSYAAALEEAMSSGTDASAPHEGKASLFGAIINIVCTTVGVGLVGIGGAFAQSGWLIGIVGMFVAGAVSIYCGMIMWRALMVFENRPIPTFMELGRVACGRVGQIATGFCQYGTCVGASILFIIIAAEQFEIIFPGANLSVMLWSLIFIAIVLPFSMIKTLAHVAVISFFGALASAVVFFVVLIQEIIVVAEGTQLANLDTTTELINTDNPMSIFTALTTFFFAFGASVIFAECNVEMKNRNRFPLAIAIGYGFAFVLYLIMGCMSYAVYGRSLLTVGGSVINALPQNWATKAMAAMFLIHLLSAFLVLLNPVFRAIETATKSDTHKLHLLWRAIQRTLLIGLCYFVAIAIPFFGSIMSLLGATTITGSSFILPCIFYLAVYPSWRGGKHAAADATTDAQQQEVGNSSDANSDVEMNARGSSSQCDVNKGEKDASAVAPPEILVRREHHIPKWEVALCITIIVVTGVLGVISTYQAISDIVANASTYHFF